MRKPKGPPKMISEELWEKLKTLAGSSIASETVKPKKPKAHKPSKLKQKPEDLAPPISSHERKSCLEKAVYLSRAQAELAASEWPGLTAYACKYQDHWHLTSRPS